MAAGILFCFLSLAVCFLFSPPAAAQQDAAGCKDHPLFTRMAGFVIDDCESKDFDRHRFSISEEKEVAVEGKKTYLSYTAKQGVKPPSDLEILRNFANAIQKAGGTVQLQTGSDVHLNLIKDGAETWVLVQTSSGDSYSLTIVEKKAMVQQITASAMLEALNKDGFVTLYINFDTNKAVIKPESKPIIEQIVVLLKETPALKVSIEGHTDGTGVPAKNKALSEERARSVVSTLASAGIEKNRLHAVGWGQEKPIADNRTEQGRAKNRRVEIVKK